MNQSQHIEEVMDEHCDQAHSMYGTRLSSFVACVRFYLRRGFAFETLPFGFPIEDEEIFLDLSYFIENHKDDLDKVLLMNKPGNDPLIESIQKDITSAAATETTNLIMKDLGDDAFAVMVDECFDISGDTQMAIAIRYVDKCGKIVERFLGIAYLDEVSPLSLKAALESFLSKHRLSTSRIRGQCYDGVSNLIGEFNGLRSLILRENPSAFYVHCFAYELQRTLVALARYHSEVNGFFYSVDMLLKVVKGLRQRYKMSVKLKKALESVEILSGGGSNQEQSLERPDDTRWGSHYRTLLSLIELFSPILDFLEIIEDDDDVWSEHGVQARNVMGSMYKFNFVFILHLMRRVLGITNDLSNVLQGKDPDMPNVLRLLDESKQRLQDMRKNGWDTLFEEVCSFCFTQDIELVDMNKPYVKRWSTRKAEDVKNLHHYGVDLFYNVIDKHLKELNDRFTETTNELVTCLSCFDPAESFSSFDKEKLTRLSRLYTHDFSAADVSELDDQLENFIHDVRQSPDFSGLRGGASSLAQKLVATRRNLIYPLVYRLLKLILLLPVSGERVPSIMNFVKSHLQEQTGDDWMSNCLVTYVENGVSSRVGDESIIQRYQSLRTRREGQS